MASTNPVDMFSEITGCQCSTNSNVDNDTNKKSVAFMLNNKTEKTARKPDLYLKKLNNKTVLPRNQSEDTASDDIAKRNITEQLKVSRGSQTISKKQLDKNIIGKNEKSTKISKPKSKCQENRVYISESNENERETVNYCEIDSVFEFNDLTRENSINNVGIVNVNYDTKLPGEEENNDYKLKNLTVQKTPRVDVKPDLVTQKLTNIQIKPDNKTTVCNLVPNVAYSEFAFELEPGPLIQQRITKNKKEARNEIREILCGMLDIVSQNDPINDELLDELQKILINLERTNSSNSNINGENLRQLEYLVEQHSMAGFDEKIIKRRLLEIAENLIEGENDEFSFDQMSEEIEKNAQQLLQRLNKIKNTILTIIPSVKFPKNDNVQDHDGVIDTEENNSIQPPNNNINLKNNEFNDTSKFVSLREYLYQESNNSMKSNMCNKFENVSAAKEFNSENV